MIIENRFYRLELASRTGAIQSLEHKNGKQFICTSEVKELFSLFVLENGEKRVLSSSIHDGFSVQENEREYLLFYKNVGGEDIDVEVILRAPYDSPFTYWKMRVQNRSGLHLDKIDFPKIVVKNDLIATGGKGLIFTPMMEGAVIEDVTIRDRTYMQYKDTGYPACGWEGIYPGATPIQFMAYYDDMGGLYFAAHDPFYNPKVVEFHQQGEGIQLELQLFTGGGDTSEFSYEYETVLGVFDGDWYDAAEIYRNFVESSGMITMPKFKDNASVPEWLRKSPIVTVYPVRGEVDSHFEETTEYYPYTKATNYVIELGKELDSVMMPLLMHWEGTAPWAPPYVWPPYGDFQNFNQYIEELHENGHYFGVYCSGIAWTQTSKLVAEYSREADYKRDGIEKIVVKGPQGQLEWSNVCGAVGFRYDMCPACEQTKEIAVTELEKIVANCDVDYVQFFDQNLGGGAYACYATDHGHGYGPGKWKNEAMLELTDRMYSVIEKCGKKNKVLIGCEGNAAEPFIQNFFFNDSRHNINYWFGNPVPAYNYLFHEYVNNFMGNQNSSYPVTDFEKYPENIYFRYAHAFVQGDVLTIVLKDKGKIHWDWCTPWNVPEVNQEEIKSFIKTMNDWRKNEGKDALQFGRMIKPLPVICGQYIEEIKYGGEHHYSSIETACYLTESGKKKQFFVNFLSIEQTIEVILNGDAFLIEDAYLNNKIKVSGDKILISLPPHSIKMLEF